LEPRGFLIISKTEVLYGAFVIMIKLLLRRQNGDRLWQKK